MRGRPAPDPAIQKATLARTQSATVPEPPITSAVWGTATHASGPASNRAVDHEHDSVVDDLHDRDPMVSPSPRKSRANQRAPPEPSLPAIRNAMSASSFDRHSDARALSNIDPAVGALKQICPSSACRSQHTGDHAVIEYAGAIDANREARCVEVAIAVRRLRGEVELLIGRRLGLRHPEPSDIELADHTLDQHLIMKGIGIPLNLVASSEAAD